VVDDAIDEGCGASSVGEDGGPIAEGEIRGEDGAFSLVATTDDLEQEVSVSVVEGEKADLVDDQQTDLGVVFEPAFESSSNSWAPRSSKS
jgi:hypothetical protein